MVGGQCTGKSSLCRILRNYAVRAHRQPVFADINLHHNDVCSEVEKQRVRGTVRSKRGA